MIGIARIQQARFGLGISVLILLTILYVVHRLNKKNAEASAYATHSSHVILKIEGLYSEINEIESAQRGYIITHSHYFLRPYKRAEYSLFTKIIELKEMVSDNPIQAEKVEELEDLIQKRLLLLKQNMSYPHPSTNHFLMGNLAMTRVLLKMRVIKEVEEDLMKKRLHNSTVWADKSTVAVIVSVTFVTMLILIAYIILINEYRKKEAAEKKLLYLHHQLKDKIDRLDESNRELEQFAYVASHDLQEPLRKIMTFNELIRQKFSDNITDETKDYLKRSSGAANRMRSLIDDLLSYSRVSRKDVEKVPVSLEHVLSIIKDTYEITIQNRDVQFVQQHPLPKVLGDKTQMIQLFQNLISNAIKFTSGDVTPIIELSCSIVDKAKLETESEPPVYDSYYKITVKDNGIGFSDHEAEKIFVIFQRLHGRSEYEGTGIGLSICKKIVENHRGYIKATGNKGEQGSSFFVYLPTPPLNYNIL
jgi:signal transduction histidine kinase